MGTFSPGISLCMIVKNEERFLAAALESVAGVVDEICIADTGSTDGTREIARAHGARLIDIGWYDDFSRARNAALAMATRRWIVVLDADERLDPASAALVAAIGRTPVAGRGKWISCRNLTDNYKGSGAMTNALVRIFPNDARIRYRNPIHEFVSFNGGDAGLAADRTAIEIIHHGYLSTIVAERAKGERNLRLSKLAAQREPADAFHQYNLGMASVLAGDYAGAISALERTRQLTRATPRGYRAHALVALADLYAEYRGDPRTAHLLIAECLALVPNYSNAHFTSGKLHLGAGDLHAARDAFGRAIAAGAHDREQFVVDNEIAIWKAQNEIGATLMREQRCSEALAWFELAARVRPAVLPLIVNRAKCHEELGDLASARTLLEAAFTGYRDARSTIEWVNFLLRRGENAAALTAVDAALPHVDDDTAVLLLGTAAAVYLRSGRRDRAQRDVDRAVERGNRAAATAQINTLAEHLGLPELAALLPAPARAKRLSIAYAS